MHARWCLQLHEMLYLDCIFVCLTSLIKICFLIVYPCIYEMRCMYVCMYVCTYVCVCVCVGRQAGSIIIWILQSSGLLRGVRWFETDVSGLPIGPIFGCQTEMHFLKLFFSGNKILKFSWFQTVMHIFSFYFKIIIVVFECRPLSVSRCSKES